MEELLFGSPGHRPLSSDEMTAWAGYFQIQAWEMEQAKLKAKKKR